MAAGLGVALIPLLALGAAAAAGGRSQAPQGRTTSPSGLVRDPRCDRDQLPVSTMLDDLDWAARQFVASMS